MFCLLGMVAKENLFSLKTNNKVAGVCFVKCCLKEPQDFWDIILWADETKVEMFDYKAQQHGW